MNLPTFIALTWDMPNLSHAEQARAFCEGGSRFLQMRSKAPSSSELLPEAVEFVEVCREFGSLSVINDFPELALAANADGVHLGPKDGSRLEARRFLGSNALIGGTVNSLADAEKIVSEGVCDYVGVGPFRKTDTKKNHAPVLSSLEINEIMQMLGNLPAFLIGGISLEDLPEVMSLHCHGLAVCGALFAKGQSISDNVADLIGRFGARKNGLAA